MTPLPDEKRWEIIQSFKSLKSVALVSRALNLDRKVVRRWIDRYNSTASVAARKPGGRKPSLTTSQAALALQRLTSCSTSTAASVAKQLQVEGVTSKALHKATVIRHARQAAKREGAPALRALRGAPAKRLTQDTKTKRLAFSHANKSRSWRTIMFTDRKKFLFKYPGVRVGSVQWGHRGDRRLAAQPTHPMSVNVYAGLTPYGITKCHVVAGSSKHSSTFTNKKGVAAKNITSHEYKHVLTTTLLPEGRRLYSTQGVASWTLQQDNDPTHRIARVTINDWNAKNASSVQLLPNWPPNSPDLSPIENVWAYVQAKVDALGCSTFEEFKAAVVQCMQQVPKHMINRLYDSMPKRLSNVVEMNGDRTGY